jgi:hypothetical protein
MIVGYLVFGALFGMLTYSNRHLFSEGSTPKRVADQNDLGDSRAMWVMISTMLWPILTLTRVYSAWRLSRVRASAPVDKGR